MKTTARRASASLLAAVGLLGWSGTGLSQTPGSGDKNGIIYQEKSGEAASPEGEGEENGTPGSQRDLGVTPSKTREAGERLGREASNGEPQEIPVTGETTMSAASFLDQRAESVRFEHGEHDVTEASRQALQSKFNQLNANGKKVEKAVVIVWQDEVIEGATETLDQSALAYRRGELLKRSLTDMGVPQVEIVSSENLTEAFPRAFASTDSDLKAVRKADDGRELKGAIEAEGGPSEALVIFLMEEKTAE